MGYGKQSTRSRYAYGTPAGSGTSVLTVITGRIACTENNGIWISQRSTLGVFAPKVPVWRYGTQQTEKFTKAVNTVAHHENMHCAFKDL